MPARRDALDARKPAGRRRNALVIVALALAAACVSALALLPDRLDAGGFTTPGSPSDRAAARATAILGYDPQPGMVVRVTAPGGAAPAPEAVAELVSRLGRDPAVGRVDSARGRAALPALRLRGGRAELVVVHFRSREPAALAAPITRLEDIAVPGLRLEHGGYALAQQELAAVARRDLVRAELLAFPALLLLLLVIFRGWRAAAIPALVGGVAVVGTVVGLRLIGQVTHLSLFALNLAVFLGLGLAVDYALLMVSRFREALSAGESVGDAVARTEATAGRTVVHSGAAIAGICSTLLLFPQRFIASMGVAGVLVAVLAAGGARVLVPRLLLDGGLRLAGPGEEATSEGRWSVWAGRIGRHPLDAAAIATLLLVAAAAPAIGLRTSFPDLTTVPRGTEVRAVADAVAREAPAGLDYPVVAVLARGAAARAQGAANLLGLGNAQVLPGRGPHGEQVVLVLLRTPALSAESRRLVAQLRKGPGVLAVGGRTAELIDLRRSVPGRLGAAGGLAALLSLLVVTALTRAPVLAIKSLLLHALASVATLGLLTVVFVHGALGLGGGSPPALDLTMLAITLISTLALSTDYAILVLARLVEEHRSGLDDHAAVAATLQRTAPLVARSALLLVVALGALATSSFPLIRQLTAGQIIGILLDVSLVRLVLVPALVLLLGRWNWWWPSRVVRVARGR